MSDDVAPTAVKPTTVTPSMSDGQKIHAQLNQNQSEITTDQVAITAATVDDTTKTPTVTAGNATEDGGGPDQTTTKTDDIVGSNDDDDTTAQVAIDAAAVTEEKQEGCALEQELKLDTLVLHNLYYEVARHIVGLGLHGYITYRSYEDSEERDGSIVVFVCNIVIWFAHAFIRALMDWNYDCLAAGSDLALKKKMFMKFFILDILNIRRLYDINISLQTQSVGMGLMTTRVVEALVKQVFQILLAIATVLNALFRNKALTDANQDIELGDILAWLLPLLAVILYSYENSRTMRNFETTMNPKLATKMTETRIYFAADVLFRAVAHGFFLFYVDIPISIFIIYVNRGFVMFHLYYTRGYIYPPKADETTGVVPTTDGSTTKRKLIFSFFPAGFVQVFTDFPFNGDLASKPQLFLFTQFLGYFEGVLAIFLSIGPLRNSKYDYELFDIDSSIVIVFLLFLGVLLVAKWILFYTVYFPARIPVEEGEDGKVKAKAELKKFLTCQCSKKPMIQDNYKEGGPGTLGKKSKSNSVAHHSNVFKEAQLTDAARRESTMAKRGSIATSSKELAEIHTRLDDLLEQPDSIPWVLVMTSTCPVCAKCAQILEKEKFQKLTTNDTGDSGPGPNSTTKDSSKRRSVSSSKSVPENFLYYEKVVIDINTEEGRELLRV